MSKKRTVLLVVFILASVFGMWARHAAQRAEQRKREELFRRLSLSPPPPGPLLPAPPTPPPAPPEPRDMFDSDLPRETFELVRQAVGRDFKLMQLRFDDGHVSVNLSADGETVQQYRLDKDDKRVEGPSPVQLLGEGKLTHSLYDPSAADFSLIPKVSKEALERAGLEGAKVSSVSFAYPFIRYAGEGPEWTVYVEAGEVGKDWQSKHVTFNTKGKFKSVF